ncbi:hypothetical protein BT69DRAFT_1328053 [Atractiella rhizophila]|nr:hypothetical protein BT69DRAFT_1328053 [Atractiella rhizophila]
MFHGLTGLAKFSGSAYHDLIFGLKPVPTFVNRWIWGRFALPSYTVIVFSHLEKEDTTTSMDPSDYHVYVYLARPNEDLINYCSSNGSSKLKFQLELVGDIWKTKPHETGFPTDNGTKAEHGMKITISEEGKTWHFEAKSALLANAGGNDVPYARYSAKVVGGEVGGKEEKGIGTFDYIHYGP